MNRADYRKVADALDDRLQDPELTAERQEEIAEVARTLAVYFGLADGNFNPEKFFLSIGLDEHGRL